MRLSILNSVIILAVLVSGQDEESWSDYKLLRDQLETANIVKRAKNVILFVASGMGVSTISAARAWKRDQNESDSLLTLDTLPNVAMIRVDSADSTIPDSGTALLCGVKANRGTVGVNSEIQFQEKNCTKILENQVESIFVKARRKRKLTGLVSTRSLTFGSPAAAYAHVSDRGEEANLNFESEECKDIARQLIEDSQFEVMLGGGRQNYIASVNFGNRKDEQNLFDTWRDKMRAMNVSEEEFQVVTTRQELTQVDTGRVKQLFASFPDHKLAGQPDQPDRISISEMMEKAIEILSQGSRGYFLLVEGGLIDAGHGQNVASRALRETIELDRAVARALELVNSEDTLVVVTADHSHGLTFNGYAAKNGSVFGPTDTAAIDGTPYTQLLYSTGPGFRYRYDEQHIDQRDPNYKQLAAIPTREAIPTAEDVVAFAAGPMAHLLRGNQHQTYIAHFIQFAACIGDYSNEDHCLFKPVKQLTRKPKVKPTVKSRRNASSIVLLHPLLLIFNIIFLLVK